MCSDWSDMHVDDLCPECDLFIQQEVIIWHVMVQPVNNLIRFVMLGSRFDFPAVY